MNIDTTPFRPGHRYRFRPTVGKWSQKFVADYNSHTLRYLRDELGDWKSMGQRVVHHIFQWTGGALECFSAAQLRDFDVREM